MEAAVKAIKIKGYERDPELVRDGAPVGLGWNTEEKPDGTVERTSQRIIIVRPLNSAAYEDRLTARRKNFSRAALSADPEIESKIQKDCIVEAVFVGFENIIDAETNEPLQNTKENRRALIEDRDFYVQVLEASAAMETFRRQIPEGTAGNSQPSSNGG